MSNTTILKVLCCPVVLLAQSIRLFVLGCFGAYFDKVFDNFCGLCGSFTDKKFPPNLKSIGPLEGKTRKQSNDELEWRRLADIFTLAGAEKTKLFSGKVEPKDICQGALGNCWLLSALACLAKADGVIQSLFLTKQYNTVGRYKVKLFDQAQEKWVVITVDDWIPYNRRTKTPMFTQPHGNEGWVLILEKAFAKLKGGYASLDGGSTAWGLETLTGDNCFKYLLQQKEGVYKKNEVFQQEKKEAPGQYSVMIRPTGETLSPNGMFEVLLYTNRRGAFMAASTGAGNDKENTNGIVHGHAYAILSVKEIDKIRLVHVRNPWGRFEWTGDWSDRSPLWKQHPKVARALKHVDADDGTFWMAWADFSQYFHSIDICERTRGFDDIALDVHEGMGCIGPAVGCCEGCAKFWCCCTGLRAYVGTDPSTYYAVNPTGSEASSSQATPKPAPAPRPAAAPKPQTATC